MRQPSAVADTLPPLHRGAGQALVEFALVLIPFVILLMGVIDLGRGIYMMNGTSEAARDINRATIVHLTDGADDLGFSDRRRPIPYQHPVALIPGLEIDPGHRHRVRRRVRVSRTTRSSA